MNAFLNSIQKSKMEFRIAQSSGKMRMLPAERKEETSGSNLKRKPSAPHPL